MRNIYAFVLLVFLASCSSEVNKKALVLGRGKLQIQDNNVTMTDGAGSADEEMNLETKWNELNVESPAGKNKIAIPADAGYYILNLKKDTIVGSFQDLNADLSSSHTITQEELKLRIDSLIALTNGANINNKMNFICLPGQLTKVSSNVDAKVFGPYKKIPSSIDAPKNGGKPEIYKFYTNTEVRELIETFKKSSMFYMDEKNNAGKKK